MALFVLVLVQAVVATITTRFPTLRSMVTARASVLLIEASPVTTFWGVAG